MKSPLDIGADLRLDQFGPVRVEESPEGLDESLLLIRDPALAHHLPQALGQSFRTLDAEGFHKSIISAAGMGSQTEWSDQMRG